MTVWKLPSLQFIIQVFWQTRKKKSNSWGSKVFFIQFICTWGPLIGWKPNFKNYSPHNPDQLHEGIQHDGECICCHLPGPFLVLIEVFESAISLGCLPVAMLFDSGLCPYSDSYLPFLFSDDKEKKKTSLKSMVCEKDFFNFNPNWIHTHPHKSYVVNMDESVHVLYNACCNNIWKALNSLKHKTFHN